METAMENYLLEDVLRIVDITRECLNEWLARGYIKASIDTIKDSSEPKDFTLEDIFCIALFRHLIEECSISCEVAGEAIKVWKEFSTNNPDKVKNDLITFIVLDSPTLGRKFLIVPAQDSNVNSILSNTFKSYCHNKFDSNSDYIWNNILIVNVKNILDSIFSRN
jgi:hypothetical protein